jgi:hypothetical protein
LHLFWSALPACASPPPPSAPSREFEHALTQFCLARPPASHPDFSTPPRSQFETAAFCFQRAGDAERATWADAELARQQAGALKHSARAEAGAKLKEAARLFASIGKWAQQARCLEEAGEFGNAAVVLRDKVWGPEGGPRLFLCLLCFL